MRAVAKPGCYKIFIDTPALWYYTRSGDERPTKIVMADILMAYTVMVCVVMVYRVIQLYTLTRLPSGTLCASLMNGILPLDRARLSIRHGADHGV